MDGLSDGRKNRTTDGIRQTNTPPPSARMIKQSLQIYSVSANRNLRTSK